MPAEGTEPREDSIESSRPQRATFAQDRDESEKDANLYLQLLARPSSQLPAALASNFTPGPQSTSTRPTSLCRRVSEFPNRVHLAIPMLPMTAFLPVLGEHGQHFIDVDGYFQLYLDFPATPQNHPSRAARHITR